LKIKTKIKSSSVSKLAKMPRETKFIEFTPQRKEFFLEGSRKLLAELDESGLLEFRQGLGEISTKTLTKSLFGTLVIDTIKLGAGKTIYYGLSAAVKQQFLDVLLDEMEALITERLQGDL
jgi:hypothetical protein